MTNRFALIVASLLMSTSAFAADVEIASGKTAMVNGSQVQCKRPTINVDAIGDEAVVLLAVTGRLGACEATRGEESPGRYMVEVYLAQKDLASAPYVTAKGESKLTFPNAAAVLRGMVKAGACD